MKTWPMIALFSLPFLVAGNLLPQENESDDNLPPESMTETHSGWLGVSTQDVSGALSRKMNLTVDAGAFVNDVMDDSPAEKAGIRKHDVIVELNGKRIDDADDLLRTVRKTRPGSSVSIVVVRDNDKKTVTATIGSRPRDHFGYMPPLPPMPPRSHMHLRMMRGPEFGGLSLLELNEQLGAYFEAPNNKGVLVEEVEKNSSAEKAGFKAGDVIVKVGKEPVESLEDMWDALEQYKSGDKADVGVIRKGSSKTLTMNVEEERHDRWFRFRSGRWPHQSDFDLDLDSFQLDMDHLKKELKTLGKDIQQRMGSLRDKIRKEIRAVVS